MKIVERITEMSVRAKANNVLLSVSDIRYTTAGIPTEITEEYIYFADGWEIGQTGKLGGVPTEAEKLAPGGKMIRMESIIAVDMIKSPK